MAASGVVHVSLALAIHWMFGGQSLRVTPPPRGTVSLDLQAAWASPGGGFEGPRKEAVRVARAVPRPVEEPRQELTARRLPVSPVGQLPPVMSDAPLDDSPTDAGAPVPETPVQLEREQPEDQPRVREPPALPRTRRATRAGLDLASDRRTEAWTPPSAASRRSEGAQTDVQPTKVFSPQPRYPPELLAARVTGTVKLLVHVTRQGRVARVAVHRSSGRRALDQAALEAVRRWRFQPARRAGVAVSIDVIIPVRFTIAD